MPPIESNLEKWQELLPGTSRSPEVQRYRSSMQPSGCFTLIRERDSSRINKILKHILIFVWGNDFNSFFRQTLTRWPYLVWNLLRDNLSLHFQHPFALSLWLLELRECAITPTLILAHLKFTCNLKTLLSLCCYEQCHYINIFLMPLFQGHWTVARFSAQLL